MDFDENHWLEVITKPDWYLEFSQFNKQAIQSLGQESDEYVKLRRQIRKFFEHKLLEGKVMLGTSGPNLDIQRQPVDTIVIHHTSAAAGYNLSYMNAVQLTNIYAPYYASPTIREERGLAGQAVWSGHFKDGQQVFYAYHWFMRMDGSFERLLEDNQIGWHAGNWEINRRSVAICLDNDYDQIDPDGELLKKLAHFIKKQYPDIEPEKVLGHCEARQGTTCPGQNFINGWKNNLVNYMEDTK